MHSASHAFLYSQSGSCGGRSPLGVVGFDSPEEGPAAVTRDGTPSAVPWDHGDKSAFGRAKHAEVGTTLPFGPRLPSILCALAGSHRSLVMERKWWTWQMWTWTSDSLDERGDAAARLESDVFYWCGEMRKK